MMDKLKLLPMLDEVGGFFPKTIDGKAPARKSSATATTSTS